MSVETDFLRLMTEATVPGIVAAVIRDGRLDRYVCCGVRSAQGAATVDENTVFDAASLTKPVFAHAVLQLIDQGYLLLDAPLGDYLPDYVPADGRASSITPRQVLSHSTGLPNWRNADLPLKTYFPPGERFSYSGEGYLCLQKAVEVITGEKAHVLVKRLVFQPFAMTQSSLIWNPSLDENRAYPHDAFGRPALLFKPGEANAAGSLQTTATDYARFLLAVLDGSGLKPESAQLWLRPQIEIKHRGAQQLVPSANDVVTGVAWGLGWGLEPSEGTFFHWARQWSGHRVHNRLDSETRSARYVHEWCVGPFDYAGIGRALHARQSPFVCLVGLWAARFIRMAPNACGARTRHPGGVARHRERQLRCE